MSQSNINWFPGHMTKAKRQIQEQLKAVDMIIECRDGRIPLASSNPMIDELVGQKPRMIVLTKKDLAQDTVTEEWLKYYQNQGIQAVAMNVLKDNVSRIITTQSELTMKPKHERDARRGIRPRITRALVVGVPNVGKSTLINRLAKRKVVEVANRPGVTMSLKRIKVNDKLEVIDSPGLLWPRFDHQILGIHLALCDSIKETGYQIETITDYGLSYFKEHHSELLKSVYEIELLDDTETFYEHIATKSGQPLDRGRALFLKDIQNHRFGKVSWEHPYDSFTT